MYMWFPLAICCLCTIFNEYRIEKICIISLCSTFLEVEMLGSYTNIVIMIIVQY